MTVRKIDLPYEGEGAVSTCCYCGNDDIVYTCRYPHLFRCTNSGCNKIYNPFRVGGEITDADMYFAITEGKLHMKIYMEIQEQLKEEKKNETYNRD